MPVNLDDYELVDDSEEFEEIPDSYQRGVLPPNWRPYADEQRPQMARAELPQSLMGQDAERYAAQQEGMKQFAGGGYRIPAIPSLSEYPTVEEIRNFDDPTTFGEAAKETLPLAKQAALAPFAASGRALNLALQDAMTTVAGDPESGGNLYGYFADKPGESPYQKTLAEMSSQHPVMATAGKIAAGAAEMAPMMAAGMPAGIPGRALSLMFAADMAAAGGTAAGTLKGELEKKPEDRDWDVITSSAADLGLSSLAPFAAYHGLSLKRGGAGVRKSERGRITPDDVAAAADRDAEELFQLKQAEKAGKLSVEDSHRISELESKAASPESHLDPEDQAYLDAEREGMGVDVDIVPQSGEGPFAQKNIKGQFMGVNWKKGTVEVYPEEFKQWLAEIPAEKRAGAVRARLGEEQIHLKTDAKDAESYWNALTPVEQALEAKLYTGRFKLPEAQGGATGLTGKHLGFEAIRRRAQRLAGMESSEVAEMVGAERWTHKSLEALNDAIYGMRKALGTKASKEQRAYLDKVTNNLKVAQRALIGQQQEDQPGAVRIAGNASTAIHDFAQKFMKGPDEGFKMNNKDTEVAGLGLKNTADLDALLEMRRAAVTERNTLKAEAQKLMASGDQAAAMKAMNRMAAVGPKTQYIREAIEMATNLGSWQEGPRNKFGERPLDWQKNPDVAKWLQEHGEEVGVRISEEAAPAAIRRGGPSKRGQEIAEQKRRIAEMQAKARDEELPPELATPKAEPQFAPVPAEERVSAEAAGALPRISAKDLEARAADVLNGEINIPKDKRPTFEEFSDWAKRNMEGVRPEQLRDMWEDRVWGSLLKAEPQRLESWRKALGLESKYGTRPIVAIAPEEGFALKSQGDKILARQDQLSAESKQRYRNKIIGAIARRLIGESVEGRASLDRSEVGIDDIAFSNEKTQAGPYAEIGRDDLADPKRLNAILRDQARGSSSDPESASRRLVAVVDKAGGVHLVSTYNDAGVQRVTDPSGPKLRNKPSRELNKTFLNQYRPFASLLLTDPVKGFRQTFKSVGEFMDKMGKEAQDRARIGDWEIVPEGPAAEDFRAEGTEGLEGEGGSFMGPGKQTVVPGARAGAMESDAPLTHAEAEGVLNHIFDETNELGSPEDVKLSLDGLVAAAEAKRLTAADRMAINGYRKVFDAIEAKNPDLSREEIIDRMAAKIYENYQTSETAAEFVRKSMAEFAPQGAGAAGSSAEAARGRELIQMRDVAPTTVRGQQGPTLPAPPAELGSKTPVREPYIPKVHEEVQRTFDQDFPSEAGPGAIRRGGDDPEYQARWEKLRKSIAESNGDSADRDLLTSFGAPRKTRFKKDNVWHYGWVATNKETGERLFIGGHGLNWVVDNERGIPVNKGKIQNAESPSEEGPAALRRKIGPTISNLIRDTASFYDTWMVDRIEQHGGPRSAEAAEAFRQIIDREKKLYGDLTPVLDKARELAGATTRVLVLGQVPSPSGIRAMTWLNGLQPIKGAPFAAISRVVEAIESKAMRGMPLVAQPIVDAAKIANLEIGKMLLGKRAKGSFERHATALGYDVIREGTGDKWTKWTAALARANGLKISDTRNFFREWKAKLDLPGVDAATIEAVNQDFQRKYKNVVTHIKSDGRWQQVVHSDLFGYLENAARRATHAKAFREVWPRTPLGRANLNSVMEDVRKELPGSYQKDLNAMIRTMQGHPTDDYSSMGGLGPTAPGGSALRLFNQTVGNIMSKMALTGQLFVQPGEAIAGSTPVFLGYKNTLRGMAKVRELYPEMEKQGMVNRVIYDFSYDPKAPVRSAFKIGGNLLSKGFAEHALNEFQEATAAAAARVVADRIQSNSLSKWEKRMLPETFKSMGFNTDEVMGLMQGDAKLLGQFQRKASAFLTSGNKAISEGSRLGANRLFNSVFRFQSYPMMKANQLRKVTGSLWDAWQEGSPYERRQATEQFARFTFGNVLQGALTAGITALAYQGSMGGKLKLKEAQDEPLNFLTESYLSTISGPLYMAWRGYKSKGVLGVGENATRMAFPYTAMRELYDMTQGAGAYQNLSTFDKVGKFLANKTPGTKAIGTGLALFGLSSEDQKLDASISAFKKWRREQQGFKTVEDFTKEDTDEGLENEGIRKGFRIEMGKALEALRDGNSDKFYDHYVEAAGKLAELGKSGLTLSEEFKNAKLLKSAKGSDLTPEQQDALRAHIGDDAYDRLEYYDLMLEQAAEGVLLPKYDE